MLDHSEYQDVSSSVEESCFHGVDSLDAEFPLLCAALIHGVELLKQAEPLELLLSRLLKGTWHVVMRELVERMVRNQDTSGIRELYNQWLDREKVLTELLMHRHLSLLQE